MDSAKPAHTDQRSQAPPYHARTKCSSFQNNPARTGLSDRVPPPLFGASFAFIVNGALVESEVAEAAALSPFVWEQLSVDACAREFVLSIIESSAIASLQSLLFGAAISVGQSEVLLSRHFGNAPLECDLLGFSKGAIAATISGSVIEKRVSFESAHLSVLSSEALDDLLLTSLVIIESEDELLRLFLKLGSCDRFFVKHIQLGFLSAEGLSLLTDQVKIPPESVWQCAAK
jgi:hypothetical protein